MADHHRRYGLLFLVVFFSGFIKFSFAYQFLVGGRQGWVVNPSEDYNHWAERMRFQVNDTLLFKYEKGSDSVLLVNKDDYDNCNTGNPILKLDDGDSLFKLDRSGPFFFISGNKANCDQGQKLIIVVLAVRNRPPLPPNAPVPSAAPPKSSSSPSRLRRVELRRQLARPFPHLPPVELHRQLPLQPRLHRVELQHRLPCPRLHRVKLLHQEPMDCPRSRQLLPQEVLHREHQGHRILLLLEMLMAMHPAVARRHVL
ncbi:UNVERIFIED_CONTAM: Early nodulin-like protein 1 [Sesamum angustifolium]|uniref:Early nodulin-like protein 1 n=1 Tax=Sesamum angustifolium TaxID=2727405 RepID=A0AAW2ILY3_9LAMI